MKNSVSIGIVVAVLVGLGGIGYFFRARGDQQGPLLINVLDKTQYDDCHIKGSISVAFDQLESYAAKLDKETEIILYCSNYRCTASGHGAKMLRKQGFKNVWAYEAGMAEWYQQQLPSEGPCQSTYLSVTLSKPTEGDGEVPVITTEELREKLGY